MTWRRPEEQPEQTPANASWLLPCHSPVKIILYDIVLYVQWHSKLYWKNTDAEVTTDISLVCTHIKVSKTWAQTSHGVNVMGYVPSALPAYNQNSGYDSQSSDQQNAVCSAMNPSACGQLLAMSSGHTPTFVPRPSHFYFFLQGPTKAFK